jgi:hypothetical protein
MQCPNQPSLRKMLRILAAVWLLLHVPTQAAPALPVPATGQQIMFERLFAALGKARPLPDIAALQGAAVRSIAADVSDLQDGEWEDRDWVFLAVNHEMLVEDGQRSSTQAKVLAQRPGSGLEELGFRLSRESKAHLVALRDAMAKGKDATWTVVDLTIEPSGKYSFDFSYEPPPRLNGDLLHSPLTGLLARYLEARAK